MFGRKATFEKLAQSLVLAFEATSVVREYEDICQNLLSPATAALQTTRHATPLCMAHLLLVLQIRGSARKLPSCGIPHSSIEFACALKDIKIRSIIDEYDSYDDTTFNHVNCGINMDAEVRNAPKKVANPVLDSHRHHMKIQRGQALASPIT